MILRCDRCKEKVGEMTKGTMKDGKLICLCDGCNMKLKAAEIAMQFRISVKKDDLGSSINGMPEGFKTLFK